MVEASATPVPETISAGCAVAALVSKATDSCVDPAVAGVKERVSAQDDAAGRVAPALQAEGPGAGTIESDGMVPLCSVSGFCSVSGSVPVLPSTIVCAAEACAMFVEPS